MLVGSESAGRAGPHLARARAAGALTGAEPPPDLLTGPAPSRTWKALAKAGLSFGDRPVRGRSRPSLVLHFQRDGVPWEKINVNGGAIALGHPLGAIRAMLLGTPSLTN
ncbi:MAG: hypothetical protein U0Z44_14480 [Kouleothrix sp.]